MLVYIAFMAWPVLQFLVFYVAVNVNSILLAFQKYTGDFDNFTVKYTFENIVEQLKALKSLEMLNMIKVSLISYGFHLLVGVPLGLIFSYYIYKKKLLSGFYRVVLFLPSIIPAIVLVTIYKQIADRVLPSLLQDLFHLATRPEGYLRNISTRFPMIIFYNIFIGFGTSVLMYSNKMCSIEPSISEAANIDGATGLKEFWYVTLPLTYPTISIFIITGIASIFNNQINLFSFYGWSAPSDIRTFGYYLYYKTSEATTHGSYVEYPALSALGLILTFIAVVFTYLVRWLTQKFGPSEE